ncbi:DUF2235 domain-containing protein [Algisphaera agarilytica]|uniref:Uncharacterized protein (DUF2235 family) n=1 Tax=Algisphaera agarilytica TaxID=1385975 RepID=A0A7X0LJ80_9BACT|nr:DUF2235 domain-containing protein [Algisphaera agarilytica]MBB6428504.1 uncharacterized protein (DUF2235 family) [Algisphaera agarilytica]
MKRIVICADGTWNSPESRDATNVLQLARAIKPVANNGTEQVVFYDWGVGSDRKKLSGGISGVGIDKNIMDCYRFIVQNYRSGDHLMFFGFSRGAYTVRSLGGFIRNCGVLKRVHADRIAEAYDIYRDRNPRSSHPDQPKSKAFRRKYAHADRTPIEFIGAWDTVGSLGVPILFWGSIGDEKILFHDTEPSSIIRHARHAIAIDETREDFDYTEWDHKPNIDLKQVFFPGVHGNVGGGYADRGLSDGAFRWILDEAKACGLALEPFLMAGLKDRADGHEPNSRRSIFKLRGKIVRNLDKIGRQPVFHRSAKQRWDRETSRRRSRALKAYFRETGLDWSDVEIVG